MSSEVIGWLSSGVLVLTLAEQVRNQHKRGTSEGVSKWLFIGQILASIGFTIYSVLVRNWVFVVTNSILIANAVIGFSIMLRQRRRSEAEHGSRDGQSSARRPRSFVSAS